MTILQLAQRGCSHAGIARTLGVTEGAVRYHLRRQEEGAVDGRSAQPFLAAGYYEPILAWLETRADGPLNLAALHAWLVEEHGCPGSRRSIQRYYRRQFPRPRLRARRRVETPPGARARWTGWSSLGCGWRTSSWTCTPCT